MKAQDLFEFSAIITPKILFSSQFKLLSLSDIISDSIENKNRYLALMNCRLELMKIIIEIKKYNNDPIDETKIIKFMTELIVFIYKYFYIQLASVIYSNTEESKDVMDFLLYNKRYQNYIEDLQNKNYNYLTEDSKRNFVKSYENSFRTEDVQLVKKSSDELLHLSNYANAKKKLNSIIEKHVQFDKPISKNKENKALIPFFKLITVPIFYPELKDLQLNDPVLITRFKKIRASLQ
ncbi:hypothetical protein [Flavobacterium sp.]|uniref:hypothetical protein n=1 Tax=Flavobacterium sp. TaxID=239 RepID=UPI00391C5408